MSTDERPVYGWNLPGLLCSVVAIAIAVASLLGGVMWILSKSGGV